MGSAVGFFKKTGEKSVMVFWEKDDVDNKIRTNKTNNKLFCFIFGLLLILFEHVTCLKKLFLFKFRRKSKRNNQ